MNQLDPFGEIFLRLTLEINKHLPGYVDAYFGPAEIRSQVEAAPPAEIDALLSLVDELRAAIPEADAARQAFLAATLRAMACTVRLLAGEKLDYLDEVACLYDIRPSLYDESEFQAAHEALDALLPGHGNLAERLEAWRARFELQPDQVLPLLQLARQATRERTAALVDLVPGEEVELRLTQNQPWGAYNWYLGNARSLIEFNTDIPISATGLLSTFAHEGYPGHHTESQLKEKLLYREKGYAEVASLLLHSPAAVIAEGIATTATEIVFPDGTGGDSHDWNAEVLFPAAGLPSVPAEQMRQIDRAQQKLRYVTGNAAILYHNGDLNEAETIAYIQSNRLVNEARARKSFEFLTHPLYRAYLFTYTEGYDLITHAAGGGQKEALFKRLLTELTLPSQLAQM